MNVIPVMPFPKLTRVQNTIACFTDDRGRRDWFPVYNNEEGHLVIARWWGTNPLIEEFGPYGVKPVCELENARILDMSDINMIRVEIANHGERHMRSALKDYGLATVSGERKFNRCSDLVSTIDVQFDGGGLPSGVSRRYNCLELGLVWSEEHSS